MISTELARALHDSGLVWHPASGDAFRIDRPEVDADVFTVSEMTVEAYEHPTGTILGFNGTTEWALDSVDLEDALWLPREDQLRDLLRATFRSLQRATDREDDDPVYRVEAVIAGKTVSFTGSDAADAYGRALLALIDLSSASPVDDQAAGVPWIP
ncbi:hypothetical protein ABIB15_000339 [Marisediminicola sp. UYEF4]|uniref:pilus assembly protein CpaE n=1 Tax=Marisediminicola sp. UYEF4 TaxID=1756384 RepID=UPI00339B1C59